MNDNKIIYITILSTLSLIILSAQIMVFDYREVDITTHNKTAVVSVNVPKAVKPAQYLGISEAELKQLRKNGLSFKEIFAKYKKSYLDFAQKHLDYLNSQRHQKRLDIIKQAINKQIDFEVAEFLLQKMNFNLTLADLPA